MKANAILAAVFGLAVLPSGFAQNCTGGRVVTSFGPNGSNGYVQVSPRLSPAVLGGQEGLVRDPLSGAFYTLAATGADASGNAVNSLVRLKQGGDLDPGFGGIGFVIPQGQPDNAGSAVATDAQGNAIVASWAGTQMVVNRYSPTGDLDLTFGSSGVASAALNSPGPFGPMNVAVGGDGSVFIAAFSNDPSTGTGPRRPVVMKFTASGSLDTSFGSGGYSYFYTVGRGKATDIVVLPSGSLLVGGRISDSTHTVFFVARLLPNGRLDATFGPSSSSVPGISMFDFGPVIANGRRLALRPDGRILEIGAIADANTFAITSEGVVQLLANGTPDLTFGNAGAVTITPGPNGGWFPDFTLQDNGKILLSGLSYSNPAQTTATGIVTRLLPSGVIDTTFGTNGIATLSPPLGADTSGSSIVFNPDRTMTVAVGADNTTASQTGTVAALYVTQLESGKGRACH